MISLAIVALAFCVAYLVSALTVPVVVRIANKRQLFDFPDRDRHGHPLPVPRLGGVAVFAGLLAALSLAKITDTFAFGRFAPLTTLVIALGVGAMILFALGLYDDVRGAPPVTKIAAQLVAAIIVVQAGFRIDELTFAPSLQLSLGVLSVPVTLLWLVGVSNALNLVDGMDGLAGGVTLIALCVTTGAAIVLGNADVAWQSFALIGALLGFLRYNAPPARIFLGDSGSLAIGFILAVLTVKGATRPDGVLFALAPIFALSYPLLDTGIAILRRFLRKQPLSRADGRHIHHQIRAIGLGPRRAVTVLLLQAAFVGLLGLCVTFAPPQLTLAVAAAGAGILLFVFVYGMRWLGYHEFVEASTSFRSVLRNARAIIRDKILARDTAQLVDRCADVEELAGVLRKSAIGFGFTNIEICLDSDPVPSLRSLSTPGQTGWRVEYPITRLTDTTSGITRASYLVITCPVLETGGQAGPERIARILAPAIARWLNRGAIAEPLITRSRAIDVPSMRDSGEHYRERTARL